MERIKNHLSTFFIWYIAVLLFVIPFFWLKIGQMDLGGDASRLYFYDPVGYLQSLPLFGITPDGLAPVVSGYFLIPFVSLLALIKMIIGSSYLLISIINGLSLSLAFLSIVYITCEFLKKDNSAVRMSAVRIAGVIAGIFYVTTPMLYIDGWTRALYTHTLFFLNPLLFYLLLRYVNTKNFVYLIISLLVTFIFAQNFFPSPYFFSYYPFMLCYFLIYALYIRKIKLPIKDLLLFVILFFGLHLFHFLPLLFNLFSKNSSVYASAFTSEGKFIRGLSYFNYVSGVTTLSKNLLAISQDASIRTQVNILLFILPVTIILGFIFNKKANTEKTIQNNFLLLGLFFIIVLYFTTANITNAGLYIYKSFFNIPGFSMFRNYVGQFTPTYIFFYSLLLGQSLFVIYSTLNKKVMFIYSISLLALFAYTSIPFIRGDMINAVVNQGGAQKITIPFTMDQHYIKILNYIKRSPVDTKYLTLPLTDFAYQVFSGATGGVYVGPSTIAYLAHKEDFSGYADFDQFNDYFLSLVKNKDYTTLKNLFSILDINFIFYNSDKYIYDNNFPTYPYSLLKLYFPDQTSYVDFIKHLDTQKVFQAGKYALYSLPKDMYIPLIYAPEKLITTYIPIQNWLSLLPSLNDNNMNNKIGINSSSINNIAQQDLISLERIDIYNRITKDYPVSVSYPYSKWQVTSKLYPLIALRENYQLEKAKKDQNTYIDMALLIESKRIVEIIQTGDILKINGNMQSIKDLRNYYYDKKNIFNYFTYKYASWESEIGRYANGMDDIISTINSAPQTAAWKMEEKSKVKEVLLDNGEVVKGIIAQNINLSPGQRNYLARIVENTFSYYVSKLNIKDYDPEVTEYTIPNGINESSSYEVLINKDYNSDFDFQDSSISINNKTLMLSNVSSNNQWLSYGIVQGLHVNDYFTLHAPIEKAQINSWITSQVVGQNIDGSTDMQVIGSGKNSRGFSAEISNFPPQSTFLLSFDYITDGIPFNFSLIPIGSQSATLRYDGFNGFTLTKSATNWRSFHAVINPTLWKTIALQISPTEDSNNSPQIKVKNLSFTKLQEQPKVILRKVNANQIMYHIPDIKFIKVNPTKYIVNISRANGPYPLIFSEAFDTNWRVSVVPYSILDLSNWSRNSWIYNFIPSTMLRKNIHESSHFIANGYANGWLISPEDTNNKKNYNLIIELNNQNYFYLAAAISILTCLVCMLFLIRFIKKYV